MDFVGSARAAENRTKWKGSHLWCPYDLWKKQKFSCRVNMEFTYNLHCQIGRSCSLIFLINVVLIIRSVAFYDL